MSNTYRPILLNKITDDVVIEILNHLIPVLKEINIDYLIFGTFVYAVALYNEAPKRKRI